MTLPSRNAIMRSIPALVGLGAVLFVSQPAFGQQQPPGGGRGRGGGRGTPIAPGESCPPGTTEIRPRSCMAPEFPPPSIVDYRPHSTLVTATHLVPRAK